MWGALSRSKIGLRSVTSFDRLLTPRRTRISERMDSAHATRRRRLQSPGDLCGAIPHPSLDAHVSSLDTNYSPSIYPFIQSVSWNAARATLRTGPSRMSKRSSRPLDQSIRQMCRGLVRIARASKARGIVNRGGSSWRSESFAHRIEQRSRCSHLQAPADDYGCKSHMFQSLQFPPYLD